MDMQRSTYCVQAMLAKLWDTVDKALHADVADVASSALNVAWGAITGKPATFPPSSHGLSSAAVHSSALTNGKMVKSNANGLPADASDTDADVHDAVVKKHANTLDHARQHGIAVAADHTSAATAGKMLKADANGLPIEATNTDTDVADAVSKKHSNASDHARQHAINSAADHTGFGDCVTKNVGTVAGTVAAGDDARFTDDRNPIINGLTAEASPADADTFPFYDSTAAANRKVTGANLKVFIGAAAAASPSMSGGYVTRSGNNLLFSPDKSNQVWLYEGAAWVAHTIPDAGITVACTGLSASTAYYLYVYDNGGTLTLDLSTTAPTTQNGISVKTGATDRLLIARCYADASGNIVDYLNDASTHLINNVYNKRLIPLKAVDTTDSWLYNSSTIRQARATATNKVCFVADGQKAVSAEVYVNTNSGAAQLGLVGIGLDRTNGFDHIIGGPSYIAVGALPAGYARYKGVPTTGYHYLSWNEVAYVNGGNNVTFYGDDGGAIAGLQGGIVAEIWA